MKKQLCAVALLSSTALIAPVQADDFTYLSGGLLYDKQETLANVNKVNKENKNLSDLAKKRLEQKTNGVGFYLNGSVGFDNKVFVEGRVNHSRLTRQNLLGVGYHYPIMQQVDVYGLVGVSQRSIAITENYPKEIKNESNEITDYKHIQQFTNNYSDKLRPTVELGLKAQFNEVAGVRVAYRFAQFGDTNKLALRFNEVLGLKSDKAPYDGYKVSKSLHEGHIGGYYKISDNLAAEAGYTYTVSLKGAVIKDKSSKDHAGTIGLRYTF